MAITVTGAGERTCRRCGVTQPLSSYHRTAYNKTDGRRATCKSCIAIKGKLAYRANPKRHRESVDRCRYGLQPGDYERMLREQEHRCAICGRHEEVCPRHNAKARGLGVDHDHVSGRIRGLLCLQCNLAVGYMEKAGASPDAVAAYLARGGDDLSPSW